MDRLLLDDLRPPKTTAIRVRRVGERLLARERRPHLIFAEDVLNRDHVGRRLHARRIQTVERLDVGQDRRELAREEGLLLLADRQPRQLRYVFDLFARDLHDRCPLYDTTSNRAYFTASFFVPAERNVTTTRASSPTPSLIWIVPTPPTGSRTRSPL